jgi:hypothetical protein
VNLCMKHIMHHDKFLKNNQRIIYLLVHTALYARLLKNITPASRTIHDLF